jgi:hypothetical protein
MAPIRNSDSELRHAAAGGGLSPSVVRGASSIGRIPIAPLRASARMRSGAEAALSEREAGTKAEPVSSVSRVNGGGEHLHHAHNATASNETSPPGGPSRAHGQGSATDDNRVGIH